MKSFSHNMLCNFDPWWLGILILIAIGVLIGLILWPVVFKALSRLTDPPQEGILPKEVAKYFKENFDHKWPGSMFYPGTISVVHGFEKLKNYIKFVDTEIFTPAEIKHHAAKNEFPAMGFYFGKSYRKHYLQDTHQIVNHEKVYRCVPKHEYTMFLYPVWYRECVKSLKSSQCRPPRTLKANEKLPELVKVFKLEYVSDPFAETDFNNRIWKLAEKDEGQAFDLGHTNP